MAEKENSLRFLYFAYGSNMLRERLEKRVGPVTKVGTAFLEDYELQFNCGTMVESFVNVEHIPNKKVFGVLYELTVDQLNTLDKFEGLYFAELLPIDGKLTTVYISWQMREEFINPPTLEYLSLLYQGYMENNYKEGCDELREKLHKQYGLYISIEKE